MNRATVRRIAVATAFAIQIQVVKTAPRVRRIVRARFANPASRAHVKPPAGTAPAIHSAAKIAIHVRRIALARPVRLATRELAYRLAVTERATSPATRICLVPKIAAATASALSLKIARSARRTAS